MRQNYAQYMEALTEVHQ